MDHLFKQMHCARNLFARPLFVNARGIDAHCARTHFRTHVQLSVTAYLTDSFPYISLNSHACCRQEAQRIGKHNKPVLTGLWHARRDTVRLPKRGLTTNGL
jgi:hypothetical protein